MVTGGGSGTIVTMKVRVEKYMEFKLAAISIE